MNEFQERLKELLIENDMSRLQLANMINISATTINGYFNKNYYPELQIALKITKFFKCSLDYLFGLTDTYKNYNNNSNNFFENFKYLLQQNNLSIAKSLKLLKMGEYNYYRWKIGQFPKTINILEIAKFFDVSFDWLVGNTAK